MKYFKNKTVNFLKLFLKKNMKKNIQIINPTVEE